MRFHPSAYNDAEAIDSVDDDHFLLGRLCYEPTVQQAKSGRERGGRHTCNMRGPRQIWPASFATLRLTYHPPTAEDVTAEDIGQALEGSTGLQVWC